MAGLTWPALLQEKPKPQILMNFCNSKPKLLLSLAMFETIRLVLGLSQFTTLPKLMNLELDRSRDNLFFSVSCLVVFYQLT